MGIKNGCNEGLNGGGNVLGQGAEKSKAAGARAEGVKKIDVLLLGNGWKTIIAFTPSGLELNPKFPTLSSLCHQQISRAC